MAKSKKEFNKEAMYKKIMPSMTRGAEESSEESKDELKEKDNTEIDNDSFEEIVQKDFDIVKTSEIIDEQIEAFYDYSNSNTIDTNDDKITVNFVELLVKDKLENVLKKFKCCKCQSCINDIIVIALENLPEVYFSGNKKEIEEALNEFKNSNNIDVVTNIIKAIILVRKKAKH